MTFEWLDGLNEAKALSERLGLSFWVYRGCLYLQDGGERGCACTDEFTYDSHQWGVWDNASSRSATEEESRMWDLITSLSSEKV